MMQTIVIVGSTASFKSSVGNVVYSSTKHSIAGFIENLQSEFKEDNVRVVGFHPGGFNSNLRGGTTKEGYMKPEDLAKFMINIIELPKSVEVSKIVINKKIIN